jgi:hypothetical protein
VTITLKSLGAPATAGAPIGVLGCNPTASPRPAARPLAVPPRPAPAPPDQRRAAPAPPVMDAARVREVVHEVLGSQGDETILDYLVGVLEDEHFPWEDAFDSLGPILVRPPPQQPRPQAAARAAPRVAASPGGRWRRALGAGERTTGQALAAEAAGVTA